MPLSWLSWKLTSLTRLAGVRRAGCLILTLLASLTQAEDILSFSANPDLDASMVRSGYRFLTPETRSLQDDDFANPGYLWVDQGRQQFHDSGCNACHQEGALTGAATRYPQLDPELGLINLEARINQCVEDRLERPALKYESHALLSLSAYITNLSKGRPYQIIVTGAAEPHFTAGREYFFSRRGQLNLACNQCHDDNWGRMLRGDKISQGHPNAYPGYRLEWQTLGSLHRRIQDCDTGIRARPFPPGSTEYTQLELYLAWRARQLGLESPGVRR